MTEIHRDVLLADTIQFHVIKVTLVAHINKSECPWNILALLTIM